MHPVGRVDRWMSQELTQFFPPGHDQGAVRAARRGLPGQFRERALWIPLVPRIENVRRTEGGDGGALRCHLHSSEGSVRSSGVARPTAGESLREIARSGQPPTIHRASPASSSGTGSSRTLPWLSWSSRANRSGRLRTHCVSLTEEWIDDCV